MRRSQVNSLARTRWLSRMGRAMSAFFRHNLRARVALGLGLPILLTLTLLSLAHYWRERHLLTDQARLTASQISQVVVAGLGMAPFLLFPKVGAVLAGEQEQKQPEDLLVRTDAAAP